jgi:subtilase family serine protease
VRPFKEVEPMPIVDRFTRARIAISAMPLLFAAGCSGAPEVHPVTDDLALSMVPGNAQRAICGDAPPGEARCHARARVTETGEVQAFASASGLGPADLRSAYAVPSGGAGVTVAIIDAFDDPKAESDLATYRSHYGLPACTTANGCFKKVNQNGLAGPLPKADTGWASEISLDADMVSAVCPACKILLVEANSASLTDLGTAVSTAVRMGAKVVSNSYGGSEGWYIATAEQFFNHPGVAITVSTGDNGYGVEYPASSKYVIAVGGTSLVRSGSARGWTEHAWTGTGSGCSTYVAKPSYQKDTGCARRTVADVSAVADPNTGVAVYDTYGASGWAIFGGTSASAPIVAAILAAAGKASVSNAWPYANAGAWFDVMTGSNGNCGGSYLCTAKVGFDGPTGLGTPNGAIIAR